MKIESEHIFIPVLRVYHSDEKICSNDDITLDCTCDTSTLVSTADMGFGKVNWDGVLCCHCRILSELSKKGLEIKYQNLVNCFDLQNWRRSIGQTIA